MTIHRTLGIVLAAALALTACGGSDGSSDADSATEATYPAVSEETADETTEAAEAEADTDVVDTEPEPEEVPEPDVIETEPAPDAEPETVPAEEAEPVGDTEPTVWDVDPFGHGCTPGTTDGLPDGLWFGYAVAFDSGEVVFDLVCAWDREELFNAGVITVDEVFPNDFVLNENPTLRNLAIGPGAVARTFDIDSNPVVLDLGTEWSEPHTLYGAQPCPATGCYSFVRIEGGVVVELNELYQS